MYRTNYSTQNTATIASNMIVSFFQLKTYIQIHRLVYVSVCFSVTSKKSASIS